MQRQFIVLIFVMPFRGAAFQFIRTRRGRCRCVLDGIRRKMRVGFPLRDRFARKRFEMRRRAARSGAWAFDDRMAKARTAAVARTTVAAVTPAAIETSRLARLIIARRLVLVFRLRLRFVLRSFGRRCDVKRIVPRCMRTIVRMHG